MSAPVILELHTVAVVLWCFMCCFLVLHVSNATASTTGTISNTSPVPHFAESLAASSAHGTIVAISCSDLDHRRCGSGSNKSCVVVIAHSPYSEEQQYDNIRCDTNDDLDIIPHYGSITSNLHYLHSDLLLGMTGFAPDVNHLLRSFANTALQYEYIMSSCGGGSSTDSDLLQQEPTKTIPVRKLVIQGISKELRNAALSNNGRPYGVQALMVGRKPSLEIYTVDSIGGWTHWGGGATAIGRNNQKIRIHLAAELQKRNNNNTQLLTIEEAVRIALTCIVRASSSSQPPKRQEEPQQQPLLEDDESTSLAGQNLHAIVMYSSPLKPSARLTPTYMATLCTRIMNDLKQLKQVQ
jgi:20S proteasome alpha/beta subunit